MNGPTNGIRLNTNIIAAISSEYGRRSIVQPMKHIMATINASIIFPTMEPRNFLLASRHTPRNRCARSTFRNANISFLV